MQSVFSQFFVTPPLSNTRLDGKTVLVTGANSGLGLEVARRFLQLGACRLVMAVRNVEAGEVAKEVITQEIGADQSCDVWYLDLAKYTSVQDFAARAVRELKRLDILVCNAGIATRHFVLAADNESTITVNVISTFMLAFLLLPVMHRTAQNFDVLPHITVVSSDLHRWASFAELTDSSKVLDVLGDPQKARMSQRYNLSKALGILVVRQLARSLDEKHISVIVNLVNPGFCRTQLGRETDGRAQRAAMAIVARSAEVGSRTIVLASTAGPISHGQYLSDGKIKQDGTLGGVSKLVRSQVGLKIQLVLWKELLEKVAALGAYDVYPDAESNYLLRGVLS